MAQQENIQLLSSFSKAKEEFKPLNPGSIGWYICGPTVYDSAHMGHARNYVNFDILRRVMTDYFGFQVSFVMNVTDIDDKIILRTHVNRVRELLDAAKEKGFDSSAVSEAQKTLTENEKDLPLLQTAHENLYEEMKELDGVKEFDVQSSFLALGRKYENEFFKDMKFLGMRAPDVVTRVSEYIPEVISFIEGIISKGIAYESENSVYFDTNAFIASPGKRYGKLAPQAMENAALLAEVTEADGSLTTTHQEKRSQMDFVLWKASKKGEPTWDSPWGLGRPGWHVECSAMCSDILGKTVDLNCGGIDLAFPHHENQLAQSEAYWDCSQWVNYFLHSGHLHIDGLKMSKSLKNFITISAATELYTARQIRLLFLLQLWSEPMDLTPVMKEDGSGLKAFVQMEQAVAAESTFTEFFHSVKGLVRAADPNSKKTLAWSEPEKALHAALMDASAKVDKALRDSIDTPTVVRTLLEMVRKTNIYISSSENVRLHIVLSVARYITKILKVFGIGSSDEEIGFGSGQAEGASSEEVLGPHLDAWTKFRDDIRGLAREKQDHSALLAACDKIRDVTLPELGIRIDDSDSSGTWKLYDVKELKLMMEREQEEKDRKEREKRERAEALARANAEKERKASIPPSELFRTAEYEGEFSKYGEDGIPTHDAQGEELTKSKKKNLLKIYKAQTNLHEKWKQRQASQ